MPFVVGIDRYLPAAFGKIHPRWKTPYISILVQAIVSRIILLLSQIRSRTVVEAYQLVVDAAIILYFIPFLYMFAAIIKLAHRKDRKENPHAVAGAGGHRGCLDFAAASALPVVYLQHSFLAFPPGDTASKLIFDVRLIGGTLAAILLGLVLYWRGARSKRASN